MGTDLVQITARGNVQPDGIEPALKPPLANGDGKARTFYIETFGCAMNVHDSEKVAGTLQARGYRLVESYEEADLILYNT